MSKRFTLAEAQSLIPQVGGLLRDAIAGKTEYQKAERAIQQLNLAVMELSVLDGISVIDVDRIVAELGGREHVQEFLSYSPDARAAIRDELVRVLEEYGFFEPRPLLLQVGRRGK